MYTLGINAAYHDSSACLVRDGEPRAEGRAPAALRRRLEGLILYSKGEGYKRLARNVSPGDSTRRKQYARLALGCFDKVRFVAKSEWEPHRLIAEVSEAQCLVWLDADEAIRRADGCRASAALIYPSLLKKIETTITAASQVRLRRGPTRGG